jgi:4'-phosphopantetheinyl transferase
MRVLEGVEAFWVDVRRLSDGDLERASRLLTDAERQNCARYVHAIDRHRCIAARWLARQCLSTYSDLHPQTWRFAAGRYGKPFVESPRFDPALSFNLSHGGDLVVCAVTERHDVGVDVEPCAHAKAIEEVAETVFTDDELVELDESSAAERTWKLVELWTLKEALMKATGQGFSLPPRTFSLSLGRKTPALVRVPMEVGQAGDFHFHTWRAEAHVIAVAVRCAERPIFSVREFER